ncbi:MAG: IMPACT family protein [Thermoanaerobaculia bacterium]
MTAENDRYRVLAGEAGAELRVQRSRFAATAFPVASAEEFEARLAAIAKEDFDATHHCWAFRLVEEDLARSADAGEPAGTAGRPILQAIVSAGLHDAAVVVSRWFGGVKLGTGGLARAYRDAAQAALAAAPAADRWIYERLAVTAAHRDANAVFRMIAPPDLVLVGSRFGDMAEFEIDVRLSLVARTLEELQARRIDVKRRGSS